LKFGYDSGEKAIGMLLGGSDTSSLIDVDQPAGGGGLTLAATGDRARSSMSNPARQ